MSAYTIKKVRPRSPRFPFLTLEEALARGRAVFDLLRGQPASQEEMLAIWGYGPKSSGGLQTLAAMKLYGLATEQSGKGGIALSREAVRFFLEERPGAQREFLAKTAFLPPILARLREAWKGEVPGDAEARSQLKIDHRFTESAAERLLTIYRENLRWLVEDKREETKKEIGEEETRETKIEKREGAVLSLSSEETEIFRGRLPGGITVRLLANSPAFGKADFGRLIRLLEMQREILE